MNTCSKAGVDTRTVMAAVPLLPSLAAVIAAQPAVLPSTSPLGLTVATLASLLAHVTARPGSGWPLASSGVAVSWTVRPASTFGEGGITTTAATGGGSSMRTVVPLQASRASRVETVPASATVGRAGRGDRRWATDIGGLRTDSQASGPPTSTLVEALTARRRVCTGALRLGCERRKVRSPCRPAPPCCYVATRYAALRRLSPAPGSRALCRWDTTGLRQRRPCLALPSGTQLHQRHVPFPAQRDRLVAEGRVDDHPAGQPVRDALPAEHGLRAGGEAGPCEPQRHDHAAVVLR